MMCKNDGGGSHTRMKSRAVGVIAKRARQGRGIVPAGSVTPPLVTHKHVVVFHRGHGRVPQQSGCSQGGSHPQGQGQPEGAPPTLPAWCDPPTLRSRDPATPLARKSAGSPSLRFREFSKGWSRRVGGRALVPGDGTSPRPADRCDRPDPKPDNPPMKCTIPTIRPGRVIHSLPGAFPSRSNTGSSLIEIVTFRFIASTAISKTSSARNFFSIRRAISKVLGQEPVRSSSHKKRIVSGAINMRADDPGFEEKLKGR